MLKNLLRRDFQEPEEQDPQGGDGAAGGDDSPKSFWRRRGVKERPAPLDPPAGGTAANRLLTYGVIGCIYGVIGGALLLSCTAMGVASDARDAAQSAHPTAMSHLSITDTSGEAMAVGYVSAWLEATSTDHTSLDAYAPSLTVNAQSPTESRNLRAAGFVKEGNLITVRVTGEVKTTIAAASKNDEAKTVWVQRWWQVVLRTDPASGGLSVLGLPAPIAAPGEAKSDQLFAYPAQVTDAAAFATVQEFLSALLAGAGEVSRYTSPGSSVSAVTPAPYSKVTVQSLRSSDEMSVKTAAKDGVEVHVLVTAQLENGATAQSTTYFLTVTSRAGRWEIKSIDTVPQLS